MKNNNLFNFLVNYKKLFPCYIRFLILNHLTLIIIQLSPSLSCFTEDKDNIKILDIDKEKQNDENQTVNDSDSSDIKISETLTENQPDSEFKSRRK